MSREGGGCQRGLKGLHEGYARVHSQKHARATTLPLIAAVLRGDSEKCLGLNGRDAIITGDREGLLMYYCVSPPTLIY